MASHPKSEQSLSGLEIQLKAAIIPAEGLPWKAGGTTVRSTET